MSSLQASAGSSEGARFGVDARAFAGAQASRIVDSILTLEQHMVDLTDLRDIAKAGAQQRAGELRGWLCGYYVSGMAYHALMVDAAGNCNL